MRQGTEKRTERTQMLRRGSSRIRKGTAYGKRRRARGRAAGRLRRARPTHLRLPCRRPQSSVPGSLRAGPGAGAGPAASLARNGRGARLRAAPAAALALPPAGQRGLAARACPQGPPRRRGSARGTCTPGRWGGEVRTPPRPSRPATGRPSASSPRGPRSPHRSLRVGRKQGSSCVYSS